MTEPGRAATMTWAMEREYTAQQRAVRVTAFLVMRQQAGMGGATAMELAHLTGLSESGARKLMRLLECTDWPIFYRDDGRWRVRLNPID